MIDITAAAGAPFGNVRFNNDIDGYDEAYDLIDALPSTFFGGGMTIAEIETWISKMESVLERAKRSATVSQNDDTTPLEQ